jgi:uncharacterized protein
MPEDVKDLLRYDHMVENAMRGVVREALARAAANGLPGAHHFYITFKTHAPGVKLAPHLVSKYPDEMTIVMEHQFWDLEVNDGEFGVTLSFSNRPEHIVIPFAAITTFADPSVKFGLQFQPPPATEAAAPAAKIAAAPALAVKAAERVAKPGPRMVEKPAEKHTAKPAEIVALDSFRKK